MERLRLRSIRDRALAAEMAGLALGSSLSAWAAGALGLGTGAFVGATLGTPGIGAFIGGVLGTCVGYAVGKSLKHSMNRRASVRI